MSAAKGLRDAIPQREHKPNRSRHRSMTRNLFAFDALVGFGDSFLTAC